MADTLDVLTLPEAYAAINDPASAEAGSGANDDRIASWITGVSRRMDALCGPVVQRSVTDWHSGTQHGRLESILLRETPVASMTSVTEYQYGTPLLLNAETATDLPSSAYLLDNRKHYAVIYRREGGFNWWFYPGIRNIEAVYMAGRAANTAAVDELFKLGAGLIMRRLWTREAGRWAAGGDVFDDAAPANGIGFFKAVDPMIREFLASELRGQDNEILIG
jgi:hypothetical protein